MINPEGACINVDASHNNSNPNVIIETGDCSWSWSGSSHSSKDPGAFGGAFAFGSSVGGPNSSLVDDCSHIENRSSDPVHEVDSG